MIKIGTGLAQDFGSTKIVLYKTPVGYDDWYFIIEKGVMKDEPNYSKIVLALSREEFKALAGMIGAEFDKDNNIDEFKVNKEENG